MEFNTEHSKSKKKDYNEYEDYEDYETPPTTTRTVFSKIDTDVSGKSVLRHRNSFVKVGDVLEPGQTLPGFKIPTGLRGRVVSVDKGEDNKYATLKTRPLHTDMTTS